MRIDIRSDELKQILDGYFGGDNFYNLSFIEGDTALKAKLGPESYDKYKKDGGLPVFQDTTMRVIVDGFTVITSCIDTNIKIKEHE